MMTPTLGVFHSPKIGAAVQRFAEMLVAEKQRKYSKEMRKSKEREPRRDADTHAVRWPSRPQRDGGAHAAAGQPQAVRVCW